MSDVTTRTMPISPKQIDSSKFNASEPKKELSKIFLQALKEMVQELEKYTIVQ